MPMRAQKLWTEHTMLEKIETLKNSGGVTSLSSATNELRYVTES